MSAKRRKTNKNIRIIRNRRNENSEIKETLASETEVNASQAQVCMTTPETAEEKNESEKISATQTQNASEIIATEEKSDEKESNEEKDNEEKSDGGITRKKSFKEKLLISLGLFWTFFKMGIICFGGGYAMISLIEREVVERKKWITSDEMLEIIAIAETTPGAIAINMATFIGTRRAGIMGAIFATIGVVTPSFMIIFAISFFIVWFRELKWVAYAFKGIRAAVLVLILGAVIKLMKKLEKTVFAIVCILGAFALTMFTNLDVVIVLLVFGAFGLIYNTIKRAWEKKK